MADDQLKVRGRLEAVGDSIAQLHGCSRLGQVILSTQGHRKERVLGQPSHRPTVPLLLIPTIPLHHSPRQVLLMEQQWWAEVTGHLLDGDAWQRVFAPKDASAEPPAEHQRTAQALAQSVEALPALSVVRPRSRCRW